MINMPHWPKSPKMPINLGLERIKKLLFRLEDPHLRIPPVIHITGTNGKGSTLAMMRSVLQFAGYKCHSYTTPHLIEYNERVLLSGRKITDNELYTALEECRSKADGIDLSFFEATTAAALLVFARHKADFTLLEVGMGGRLDATNVVDPLMTVITSISMDHAEYLGDSLESIAWEKAGIMKCNRTCIISEQINSVMRILENQAIEKQVPVFRGGIDWRCNRINNQMLFSINNNHIEFPLPALEGDHQILNAGNAIAAVNLLSYKYKYKIAYEDIVNGIKNAQWPGRLQRITRGNIVSTLPQEWELYIDGGHNPGGMEVIAQWAKSKLKPLYVIFGASKGKDLDACFQILKPVVQHMVCMCVRHEMYAYPAEIIYQAAQKIGISASKSEYLKDGINDILKLKCASGIVLICGSLHFIGDLMEESIFI